MQYFNSLGRQDAPFFRLPEILQEYAELLNGFRQKDKQPHFEINVSGTFTGNIFLQL